MLQTLYPTTVFISGKGDAPQKSAKDPALYRWCQEHDAILVTGDFNMLRDQAVLSALLSQIGLRVIWIKQVKGQPADREALRVAGRWTHICQRVVSQEDVKGFVLRGNGQ